jgi:hypothetical protein
MAYNPDLYDVDRRGEKHSAEIRDGALLYRVASLQHWERPHILSGAGAELGSPAGRFHRINQRASYCSNNVILCFAEMLYHMYRRVMDGIVDRLPVEHLINWRDKEARLVIFSVQDIRDLVYVDSQGARVDFDPRMLGWAVVCPYGTYEPFHNLSDMLRVKAKKGIVYPSARHSVDLAFAFFRDETAKIREDLYIALDMRLQLIPENQDFNAPPDECSPFSGKLHATMGYYEFLDPGEFGRARTEGLIYPDALQDRGYVDFVRRRYRNYPVDAFLTWT